MSKRVNKESIYALTLLIRAQLDEIEARLYNA